LEARTPAGAEHTACPVAQVPSQSRSLDPDDATVPLAYLAPFCTAILTAISPRLESQQTGIGDVYLDDVLDKRKAALSTQLKFSHKSHDPGTRVLCTATVNALCTLQPHGCHWQQQTISEIPSSIRVQQVPAGPGPYPQVVLLQTERERDTCTHQSTSHLDSNSTLSTHHGREPTARLYTRLASHLSACPELPPYHAHVDAPLHRTCWVAEQCALRRIHCPANDTPADATTEALALCKSSISLPAQDHARNEGECREHAASALGH